MKTEYICAACGAHFPKWAGQCAECEAWNTLSETFAFKKPTKSSSFSGLDHHEITPLAQVDLKELERISTHMTELDRVLGGGIVPGSVSLIGGDPGIGKSSLLLQVLCELSQKHRALYVTGEESLEQVALRARRMQLPIANLSVLAATEVETIIALAKEHLPTVMVIDSIQTMQMADLSSAAGTVSQVREAAAALTRYAKQHQVAIFLVGHVTKSGEVAGPRVLEHIVDAVIYLEGQNDSRYRLLRALKNRFGAVNELGVFAMTDKGMKEVKNPSSIFLSRQEETPGSVVVIIWEGSRPLLIEIQALVDHNPYGQPRRICLGYDSQRLNLLLAILHKHAGIALFAHDVFVNVVGGVKITETSADLAILLALIASLKNKVLSSDLIVFGEVGLTGEVRPVAYGFERLKEAEKHGFKTAIIPQSNAPKGQTALNIQAVIRLSEVLPLL